MYFSIAFSLTAHTRCFYAIFILDSSQPIRFTKNCVQVSFELSSIHRHPQLLGDSILGVCPKQGCSLKIQNKSETRGFISTKIEKMSTNPSDGTSRSSQREVNHKNKGKNSNINNKRKSTSLPSETVEYLKAWMMSPEHIAHPYPTEQEKAQIMADTGIELKQLTNWFVNNRKRYWKPRVEAKLHEQQGKTNVSGGYGDVNTEVLRQSQPLARLAPLMAESNNNSVPTDMPLSLNSIISANPHSFLPPCVDSNQEEDAESVTGATKLETTTTTLPHVVTPSRRSCLTLLAKQAPSTSTSLPPMVPTNSTMVSETDETASSSASSTQSDSESINPPLPPSLSRNSSRHSSANSLYETSTTRTERVALWMVQPHDDSVVGQPPSLDMVMVVPEGEKAPLGYDDETFTVLQVFENCSLTYTIVRDVRTDMTVRDPAIGSGCN